MTRSCMAVTVWGDEYIDLFLNYSVPSLLSPHNIPNIKNKEIYEFLIWTDEKDMERLNQSPAVSDLRQHMDVQIRGFPSYLFLGGGRKDRYWRMSSLHKGIIKYCEEQNSGIWFLPSDAIWADGSLCNIEDIIDQGKKAVVMCTLRVDGETTLKSLRPYFNKGGTDLCQANINLEISGRELVKIALANIHDETLSRFVHSTNFTYAPAHIYWDLEGRGVLARGVHLHPIFIHPDHYVTDFLTTFDADFLSRAVPKIEDYYICDDSDQMFFVDLTDPKDLSTVPEETRKAELRQIGSWMYKHATKNQRDFLDVPIWIHTGIDRTLWKIRLDDSNDFVTHAQKYMRELEENDASE